MYPSQQLIGYVFPVGACCLTCMNEQEKEEAAADKGGHAFFPIRRNTSLSDGEIVCDRCEVVLQEV